MSESNDRFISSISKARTEEGMADFWDTHSLDDYWEQTHEVEFELRAKRRRRVSLDPDLYVQIETQAIARGILPETLVNLWLSEHMHAIETAPEGINVSGSQKSSGEERSQKIRAKYPKAYEKWTEDEDSLLRQNFSNGMRIEELSNLLQRQPGAIRSRLIKIGLVSSPGED